MKVQEATRDGYYITFIIIIIYGLDHLKTMFIESRRVIHLKNDKYFKRGKDTYFLFTYIQFFLSETMKK